MFPGQTVLTPYGKAIYLEVNEKNDNIMNVQPSDWIMARGQVPAFHMNRKDVKPLFAVGDMIHTPFGEGLIIEVREEDRMFLVKVSNLQHALVNSKVYRLYESALSTKPLTECAADFLQEDSSYCEQLSEATQGSDFVTVKKRANLLFKVGNYEESKSAYENYLGSMEMIPCLNSIALCCLQMKKYSETLMYTKKCLMLIEEKERELREKQYLKEGEVTQENLITKWKKKCYILAGKAELLNKNYNIAINYLDSAVMCKGSYSDLVTEVNALKGLRSFAIKKQTKKLQKEKRIKVKEIQESKKKLEFRSEFKSESQFPLPVIDFAEFGLNTRISSFSEEEKVKEDMSGAYFFDCDWTVSIGLFAAVAGILVIAVTRLDKD